MKPEAVNGTALLGKYSLGNSWLPMTLNNSKGSAKRGERWEGGGMRQLYIIIARYSNRTVRNSVVVYLESKSNYGIYFPVIKDLVKAVDINRQSCLLLFNNSCQQPPLFGPLHRLHFLCQ